MPLVDVVHLQLFCKCVNVLFPDRPGGHDDYGRARPLPPRDDYSRYLDDDLAQRREEYVRQRMREDYARPFHREGYRETEYRRDARDGPPGREPRDDRFAPGRDPREDRFPPGRDPRDFPPGRDPRDDRPPPGRDYREWERPREMYGESRDARAVPERGGPGGYGERRMSPPRREWPRGPEGTAGEGPDAREAPASASGGETARGPEGDRKVDEAAEKGENDAR